MAYFKLDASENEALLRAMRVYGKGAPKVVDEVLHNEGGRLIKEEIMRLLPESGRTWKGKRTAAKHAQPLTQKNDSLAVTIKTKSPYHYLYFPDDGSSTIRHVGYKGKSREFMYKGADNQSNRIMDLCINRLIEKWEGD